jgi:hypothetical protein
MALRNLTSIARRIGKLEAGVLPWVDPGRGASFGPHNSRRKRGGFPQPPLRIRFGNVRRLPEDYRGERHVLIAKQLPERDGQEWVEFEEVPGPAPVEPPPEPWFPRYLDIVFVESPKHDHNE